MRRQRVLFDGFLRRGKCQKCGRQLHADRRRLYRTREAGLCFRCLREYERADGWSVERFCSEVEVSR